MSGPSGQSIEQVANAYKTRLMAALDELCREMDAAREAGFTTAFNIGVDGTGRAIVTSLKLTREF